MREPKEVVLGDHKWTVRPLTQGQVEKIDDLLNDPKLGNVTRMLKVLEAGLLRAENPADLAALRNIEAGMDELNVAARIIFELAGVKLKESGKGEEGATA